MTAQFKNNQKVVLCKQLKAHATLEKLGIYLIGYNTGETFKQTTHCF